jgi:hypothetical protein
MSNENTTSDGMIDRTSAIGTARFAHEFLSAAMHEHARAHHPADSDISSMPGFYLMGHGIELSLKAFLLGHGVTVRELRKLGQNGHDLVEAFNAAVCRGLDCKLYDDQGKVAALELLNERYFIKDFEYITTGATRWPQFGVFSALACKLYNSVAASVGYSRTLIPL